MEEDDPRREREDAVAQATAAGDQLTSLVRDFWGPMARDMQNTLVNLGIEPEARALIISGVVLEHYRTAMKTRA